MEKWNEICYYLSEKISPTESESDFELKVIRALRVLDWNEFKGDLKIRHSVQIGASNRIEPDIVIKQNNNNLFVIEVKKPGIPLNSSFKDQLKSYMRILKLDFGILIGEKIQLFYDGKLYNNSEFNLIEEIDFIKDSKKGLQFVKLFSKNNYTQQNIEEYIKIKLEELNEVKTIKNLKEELLSSDFLIENLLKKHLLDKHYNEKIIDSAMQHINITISNKDISNYYIKKEITKRTSTFSKIIKKNKLNLNKISPPLIYDINNPPDLTHTIIRSGKIDNKKSTTWQVLVRTILEIVIFKKIDIKEIMNKVYCKIQEHGLEGSNYHQIGNTKFSFQNVDAKVAGKIIAVLSKEYNIAVEIEFSWSEKSRKYLTNEYCKIIN